MHIFTEKNKLAPSQHSVTCVFDKKTGIDKFWSEFYFLLEPTISEKKIYKNLPPASLFMMKKEGSRIKLVVKNEHGVDQWKSDSFYRKDAKNKYNTNPEFKQWFDYAVQVSVYSRITQGIFKCDSAQQYDAVKDESIIDESITNVIADTLDDPGMILESVKPDLSEEEDQVGEEYFLNQEDETTPGYKSVFNES